MFPNYFAPINYSQNVYQGYTPVSQPIHVNSQYTTQQQYQTNKTNNFTQNYWQYQNYCGINNQIYLNQEMYNNLQFGKSLLNEFSVQYPYLESYTMTDALARKMQKINPNSPETMQTKTKSDILFKKMINILEQRPNYKSITFDEYLNIIKNEFRNENHGNCGERAYIVYDKLNKLGIKNHAIIEIEGKENYNSHVFNVVGISPNADINRPETWGNSAIIIDTWANKSCTVKEGLAFYYDFLEYGQDNPMNFKKLDINEIFKNK